MSYEDYGEPVQVAAFTGAGVKGTTPWIQPLSVTPADAALLAGVCPICPMACQPLSSRCVSICGRGRLRDTASRMRRVSSRMVLLST